MVGRYLNIPSIHLQYHILILLTLLSLGACQNAANQASEDAGSLNEYRPGENDLSAIIRNPVSAAGVDTVNVARIEFEEEVYDFGTVSDGDEVIHVYRFSNIGKVPLVVSDARATCGCTVPEWPEGPVAPGEASEIRVRFNTLNRTGTQRKPITITANTYPRTTKIWLQGVVESREESSTD